MELHTIAGTISTGMFAASHIPMLAKAWRSRSLASYSGGQLWTNSTANLVHWLYVWGLPFGPIWFMHSVHTVSMGLMLMWFLRYEVDLVTRMKRWVYSRFAAWESLDLWPEATATLSTAGLSGRHRFGVGETALLPDRCSA